MMRICSNLLITCGVLYWYEHGLKCMDPLMRQSARDIRLREREQQRAERQKQALMASLMSD